MRATLIHNPNAAGTETLAAETIVRTLAKIGIRTAVPIMDGEGDLTGALRDPGDLVIAAGGDGTVRATALALHRLGLTVPLALLPLGTANNIARTLGLTAPPQALLTGLATPQPRPFDLGVARGPWGAVHFLEAFGAGLLAHGLADYDPTAEKSLVRAAGSAVSTFSSYQAQPWRLRFDGEDLSGRYLLVEVMNTASVGLRMALAPEADPSDGAFDLVLVEEDERVGLSTYVVNLISGRLETLSNVTVKRGRRLELTWDGSPLHYDEELFTEGKPGPVEVSVQAGALELWLPSL